MADAPTQTLDGYVIRAKCAGDYTTQGYVLAEDFETMEAAADWIQSVLHVSADGEEDKPTSDGKWLVLEDGGVLRLDSVAALQIIPGKITREVRVQPPVRRRGRRESE